MANWIDIIDNGRLLLKARWKMASSITLPLPSSSAQASFYSSPIGAQFVLQKIDV